MQDTGRNIPYRFIGRNITLPERVIQIAVQGDNETNSLTLIVNRYYKGIDLSEFDCQLLVTGTFMPEPYADIITESTGLVKVVEKTSISLTWTITSSYTSMRGRGSGQLRFISEDDEIWSTEVFGLFVDEALEIDEVIETLYPSILADHTARIQALERFHPDNFYDKEEVDGLLDGKVNKEEGKGLSTNDLTNTLKTAYDGAVTDKHTHSNNVVLDAITAAFTVAEKTKLAELESTYATISVVDTIETDLYNAKNDIADIQTSMTDVTSHINDVISNPHQVTAEDVGLGSVDNTSDADKPVSTAQQTALNLKADLVNGVVPSNQLPSFVDDVLEYANLASFPATGTDGKIYVSLATNLAYRWGGTAYAEISPSIALGETSSTAYRGDRGKTAYDHSQIITGNPHGTTAAEVGAIPTTEKNAASGVAGLTAGSKVANSQLTHLAWNENTTMILFNATAGANTLHLAAGTSLSYTIDKGDGTALISETTGGEKTLTYTNAGYYWITITGTFNGFNVKYSVTGKVKYIKANIGTNCPIGDDSFTGCSNLTSVKFATDWAYTTIGENAFYYAKFLEIKLPTTITEIKRCAFNACTLLNNIKFPNGLVTIGEKAFANCICLRAVTLPVNIATIGVQAFAHCGVLKTLKFISTIPTFGLYAFESCILDGIECETDAKVIEARTKIIEAGALGGNIPRIIAGKGETFMVFENANIPNATEDTHALNRITADGRYEPTITTKGTAFNKNFGATEGTVCEGDDARLSDSRTANGGNADTVDNKHASDFATSAQGAKADTAVQTETDPTVPSWAKTDTKPTYTASEVGAIPATEKGAANGVAGLDASGKIPATILPDGEKDGEMTTVYNSDGEDFNVTLRYKYYGETDPKTISIGTIPLPVIYMRMFIEDSTSISTFITAPAEIAIIRQYPVNSIRAIVSHAASDGALEFTPVISNIAFYTERWDGAVFGIFGNVNDIIGSKYVHRSIVFLCDAALTTISDTFVDDQSIEQKLNRVDDSTTKQLYGVDTDGEQVMYELESTPTENSTNPIQSGAVFAALGDIATVIDALNGEVI